MKKSTTNKSFFFFALIVVLFSTQGCMTMKIKRAQQEQILKQIKEGNLQPQVQTPAFQAPAMQAPQIQAPQFQQQMQQIPVMGTSTNYVKLAANQTLTGITRTHYTDYPQDGIVDSQKNSNYAEPRQNAVTVMVYDVAVGLDAYGHPIPGTEKRLSQDYSALVKTNTGQLQTMYSYPNEFYTVYKSSQPLGSTAKVKVGVNWSLQLFNAEVVSCIIK